MRRHTKIRFTVLTLFFLVIPLFSLSLHAQTAEENTVAAIYDALRTGDFTTARLRADSALASYFSFSAPSLAEIHTLRALIYDYGGNEREVTNHFTLALQLDPQVRLDPLFFSPKLQQMLERLRQQQADNAIRSGSNDLPAAEIRYISVQDPRVAAALRSLLLPGWGQLYKNQKTRGYLFLGLASGLAIATAATHFARDDAEKKYHRSRDPVAVSALYKDFERLHIARNNLALATGIVWAAAFLDALVVLPKTDKFALRPTSTPGLALRISLPFPARR